MMAGLAVHEHAASRGVPVVPFLPDPTPCSDWRAAPLPLRKKCSFSAALLAPRLPLCPNALPLTGSRVPPFQEPLKLPFLVISSCSLSLAIVLFHSCLSPSSPRVTLCVFSRFSANLSHACCLFFLLGGSSRREGPVFCSRSADLTEFLTEQAWAF